MTTAPPSRVPPEDRVGRVRSHIARRIANAIVSVVLALLAVSIVFTATDRPLTPEDEGDAIYIGATVLGALIYLSVGRLIVGRQPSNTIGWLLLAVPAIGSVLLANAGYAKRALVLDPGSLPFGVASAWLDRWLVVVSLAAFIPILLLFPDGRLPSRRWWPVGLVAFGAPLVTAFAFAVTPGPLPGSLTDLTSIRVMNPLGIDALEGSIDVVAEIGGFATLVGAVASVVALVLRYRRATAEVRQQIRWLAFVGVAFFGVLGLAPLAEAAGVGSTVGTALFTVMLVILVVGIPVACGVAILRYHLYELDVVVRKTVVYGALAAFVTVVYVAVVVGIGAFLGGGDEPDLALQITATAVVAVAFQPVRARAQRFANRLVYGERATPYDTLRRFSDRVAGTYATEDVLPRTARVIADGVGASRVDVWLRVGDAIRPAATWPDDAEPKNAVALEDGVLPMLDAHRTAPVTLGDRLLGAITVDKPASEPFRPAEEALLADLAKQAGLVLSNVQMTAQLEADLERISAQADELRASRQRVVAAQDHERRRLERNIHDGAQQHLVALAVKLRLARAMTTNDAAKAREMLIALGSEIDDALDTLTSLALGIFPPLLEEQGLPPAISSHYVRADLPVHLRTDGVGRYPLEVEGAVYFCVLEALQNAAKYARAGRIDVTLEERDGTLRFEVRDDGAGFDGTTIEGGTGLAGMRDRLAVFGGDATIRSAPGHGTVVRGWLPLVSDREHDDRVREVVAS